MPFKDLREFIDRLEAEEELARIEAEVDWNLEVGAITRRGIETRSPAMLFEKIKDYPPGYRILGNPLSGTKPIIQGRFSLALGLPKDTPPLALIEEFGRRIERPIKPILVESGPCKEQIHLGEEVNLLELPVPYIHAGDGGRYIGTWHATITKDPDTGWVNWGMYRHMVHDSRSVGFGSSIHQHGPSIYYHKYEARGEAMPMAIAIGTEPLCSVTAATAAPPGVNEVDLAGALRGEPVELVRCETIDLEVPATSEIILEGMVIPHERKMDGPFGEYTGYSAGGALSRPIFRVQCITHRQNPILPMSNPGKPWDETSVLASITVSSVLARELRGRGLPFKSVYVPPPYLAIVVSVDPPYGGYAHTIASAIWSSKPGLAVPYIFVVGEDVDITNIEDLFWCLVTRLHPGRGIHVQHRTRTQPLIPFLLPEERRDALTSRVLFDATFPSEWGQEQKPHVIDFEHAWPREIQEKVISHWREYGLG